MPMRPALLALVVSLVALGCSETSPAPTATAPSSNEPTGVAGSNGLPPYAAAKEQPKVEVPADQALSKLDAEYTKAKTAFERDGSDDAKKAYIDATVKFATATMTSPELDAKVKYKAALKLYREALKLDPKNEEATNNSKMIEDIYKSMGRPVPE